VAAKLRLGAFGAPPWAAREKEMARQRSRLVEVNPSRCERLCAAGAARSQGFRWTGILKKHVKITARDSAVL
jgi:hypothetical protein